MNKISHILIITFMLLIPTLSQARLEFNPYITTSEEYNDNIYLDPSDEEESDWITTIEPGFSLEYDSPRLEASLDYSMIFRLYSSNTSEDETDLIDVSRAHADLTLFPNNNFNLNADGEISRVIMDDRERSSDENAFINKATLYRYTINPSYNLRLGSSLNLTFDYFFEQALYEDIEDTVENPYDANDYIEHRAETRLTKRIFGRSDIYISYAYTDFQEDRSNSDDENEDYSRHDAMTGFIYPLGNRLILRAMGGMAWIDYDDKTQDDPEGTIWNVGLDYNFLETMQATLEYSNDFTTSVSRGLSEHQEARFSLTYSRRLSITTELFASDAEYEEDNSKDQGIGALLTFTLPLGQHFEIGLNTDYAQYEYEYSELGQEDEDVDRYGAGASLSYNYNHLTATLSYNYRRNNSTDNESDYTNNIAMLELGWEF